MSLDRLAKMYSSYEGYSLEYFDTLEEAVQAIDSNATCHIFKRVTYEIKEV
jgi:hypothetical protein